MSEDMCEQTADKIYCVNPDEWTADRLDDLAWSHDVELEEVMRRCLRHGVRDYEQALDLD